jgi:hypothetical protein
MVVAISLQGLLKLLSSTMSAKQIYENHYPISFLSIEFDFV